MGESKTPAYVAFGLALLGILIAALQDGVLHGSILGGIVAAGGAIPALYGMWKGIQQETQGTLALSILAVLVALAIGGILIVLRVIQLGQLNMRWRGFAIVAISFAIASAMTHSDGAAAPGRGSGKQPDPASAEPDRKFEYHGEAMGTVISVFVWTDDEQRAATGAAAVFTEMKRIDKVMTTWLPDSEVSQINAAAGTKPIAVSQETYAVIERAQDVAKRSHGLFDISVGAFKGLWKFDQDMDGTLPDPKDVKARLAKIGYREIVLDKAKRTVFLRKKGMSITLGGIAKGYAVDKCAKLLFDQGLTNFMVQAGGDMFVAGKKGALPWVVGIRDPRGDKSEMFATAPIEDHSFSTSGDYERGFVKDGVRYHHILDPRTGQPAHASRSVTIRAKDAFTADAWSKVLFILGWKESLKLIEREKLTDFEMVVVDDKNEVHVTKGLESALTIKRKPTDAP